MTSATEVKKEEIIKITKKIKDGGLEANFLQLFLKENELRIDEGDIQKALDFLTNHNIIVLENQIYDVIDTFISNYDFDSNSYSNSSLNSKQIRMEQKVKEMLFDNIAEELQEILITNKNVLQIVKECSRNGKSQNKFPDILLKKDGMIAAKELFQNIDASEDEIYDAANILFQIKKLREQKSKQQSGEHLVKEAFLNGIIKDLQEVERSFKKILTMYEITFYAGMTLLGVAVYSALVLREDILTLILGGIGGAGMLSSLIFKPATEIQISRGNLIQLKTAYLGWINDLNNWNAYIFLKSKQNKGVISIEELKQCSEMMAKNLTLIMNLIDKSTLQKQDEENNKIT